MTRTRDYLRISLTAKSAKVIQEYVIDRTFNDHGKKCDPSNTDCPHALSLPGARAVEAGLVIGKKRATLTLQCPYSFEDANAQMELLVGLALRLKGIGQIQKGQVQAALYRVSDEISVYALRNPMVVIAEAALPPSRSRVSKPPT